ncbi:MAG: SDR family oxidoreductase [Balneolaceae bacterium]|nr:MAG: SDR family oxidoreductase [Balneolaceae bacterium]
MKHALVTGASRGIGLAIAEELLIEGFRVTGTNRKSPFPDALTGSEMFRGISVDLGEQAQIAQNLKPVFESDLPDVLINNAGIFMDADFLITDEKWLEVWDRTLAVNLRSSSLLCKWFVNAHLKTGSEGVIINISSRAAYRGDTQEYAAYAASKAGMAAFTKSMARNFSKQGVVAYTIAPGFIETDMARESVEILGKEALTRGSAFDEITQPAEVAKLAAFLAKGEVRHMTGSTFHINGGSYMV